MGLELVIFIAAILFGIFLYWRESNSNKLYRFVNKIMNSKALQMKPTDKKGFIFKQAFLPRFIFVVAFFLVLGLVIQFVTPFQIFTSYNGVSAFSSIIVGTLVGTYVANFVLKSSKVIEKNVDVLEDVVHNTIEKGKDIIEDITDKEAPKEEEPAKDTPEKEEKSARDRLKDKGLL